MMSNFQRLWLYSCFAAVLLAGWAGGFGVIFMLVFITIYLVGVVLIGPDGPELTEPDGEPSEETANEAEPDPPPEPEPEPEPKPEPKPEPEPELEPEPAGSGGDEA